MVKKRLILPVIGAVAVLFLLVGASQAFLIVDTGAGGSGQGGWAFSNNYWKAGKFHLDDPYVVTSIEGWLVRYTDGTVTAVIYNDDGNGSIPGSQRFAQDFSGIPYNVYDWFGVSGLNLSLPAGDYWVAFEVRTAGFEGAEPNNVPHPLSQYASYYSGDGYYSPWGGNIGVRINAVPLPPAAWLFASGLVGLAVMRRKYKRN